MLERLTLPPTHAISILLKNHDKVKDLFDQFEKSESSAAREKIVAEAVTELKIHAVIEEEVFYPAIRSHVRPAEGEGPEARLRGAWPGTARPQGRGWHPAGRRTCNGRQGAWTRRHAGSGIAQKQRQEQGG